MHTYQQPNLYTQTQSSYRSQNVNNANNNVLDDMRSFAQNRPGLAIAGALLGGFLLARYLLNNNQGRGNSEYANAYRPMWSYAPEQKNFPPNQPQPGERYRPMQNRPVDHMGATENQMSDRFAEPTQEELEEGAVGTTGLVYEMDRDSITAG